MFFDFFLKKIVNFVFKNIFISIGVFFFEKYYLDFFFRNSIYNFNKFVSLSYDNVIITSVFFTIAVIYFLN